MVVFFWECINFSVGFAYDLLVASRYMTDGPAKQDISFCLREFVCFVLSTKYISFVYHLLSVIVGCHLFKSRSC